MRLSEKEGGLCGVALFLACSADGDPSFFGSSSVKESVTGAMADRCGGALLEISGVDCAYGVIGCIWIDGWSGIAVMAPPGTFQSKKSGETGMSFENSKGNCSASVFCLMVLWLLWALLWLV